MGFLLVMLVLLAFMVWSGNRNRKKMEQQQAAQRQRIAEGMVPGAWVKTASGFWGRFVDRDGDIVILETPGGTETFWEMSVVRDLGEPPFATDEPEAEPEPEPEPPVLGLDGPAVEQAPESPADAPESSDDDTDKN